MGTQYSTLNADKLWSWQTCRRRYRIDMDFRPKKPRPKRLFDACLRVGIFEISRGQPIDAVVKRVQTDLMAIAANPGMDYVYGRSPYDLATDLAAMLSTILRALAHQTLLELTDPAPVVLAPGVAWEFRAWRDQTGELHRWVTVDKLDEDRMASEAHSWHVAGDMAAAKTPMTLHIIEIGRQNPKGRYVSPWSRAWRHPGLSSLPLRFAKKDGSSLEGYTPVFLSEASVDPESWVTQMEKDGAVAALIHTKRLREFDEGVRIEQVKQILLEARSMAAFGRPEWLTVPMSRGACDGMVTCPYQPACYGTQDLVKIGLQPLHKAATVPVEVPAP